MADDIRIPASLRVTCSFSSLGLLTLVFRTVIPMSLGVGAEPLPGLGTQQAFAIRRLRGGPGTLSCVVPVTVPSPLSPLPPQVCSLVSFPPLLFSTFYFLL